MNRDEKVLALGRTLLEYLPQARTPSSSLGGSAGLAASRYVPCETCGARGNVNAKGQPCPRCTPLLGVSSPGKAVGGHGCTPCLVCDGQGWRQRRAGDPEWDSVARIPLDRSALSENASALQDRLRHTERLLQLWERPDERGFAWEEKRQQMERQGSYRELGEALRWLQEVAPRRFAVWWRLIVCGEIEHTLLGERMREQMVMTTRMIAAKMPPDIRLPKPLREEEINRARKQSLAQGKTPAHARMRSERDQRIVSMSASHSVTEIAAHFSLTTRRVNQVLREHRSVATAVPS